MKYQPSRLEINTACFTGHRRIDPSQVAAIRQRICDALRICYSDQIRWFMCGGALGFDTIAAEEIIRFRHDRPDVGLFLAIPCTGQADFWPYPDQIKYNEIRKLADDEIVLSDRYYNGCMQMRNRFMVQHSRRCISYLSYLSGGTGYTVRYALANHCEVMNLYEAQPNTPLFKERLWNYTFISHSARAVASIAGSTPRRQ